MSANPPLPVPQRLTGNLFTVVSMLFWATGFPVTERLLDDWDPLTLVFVRIGLAGLVLALLWPLMSPGYAWRRLPWGRVMRVGGIGLGLGTLFLVWGQHYSNPITVAVLATTVPLVSAIMGAWAGEERLSGRLLVAIACAMAGGILTSLVVTEHNVGFRGGEVLVLLSVVLWTWYSRASVAQLADVPAYPKATATLLAGTVFLLPVLLVAKGSDALELRYTITPYHLGLLLWLAGAAIGLSTVLWLAGAQRLGVTIASMHQNAVPFYVLLFALVAGTPVQMTQVAGAVLVVCGAVLAQLPVTSGPAVRQPVPDVAGDGSRET